jgi:hypothetical protein
MDINWKTCWRRLEAAISLTILVIVCHQFSAIEQHQQVTVLSPKIESLFHFQHQK